MLTLCFGESRCSIVKSLSLLLNWSELSAFLINLALNLIFALHSSDFAIQVIDVKLDDMLMSMMMVVHNFSGVSIVPHKRLEMLSDVIVSCYHWVLSWSQRHAALVLRARS